MRIGISQDLFKAFEYYQKSANLNFANAQFQLGVCYENGIVQKDFEQAFKFYELAAKQEHVLLFFFLSHFLLILSYFLKLSKLNS